MNKLPRRRFVKTIAWAALATPRAFDAGRARAANRTEKIKIGQIGTRHAHAAGKIATIRKLDNLYEVVGVVEPDPERRAEMETKASYRGLPWMSEDELLANKGLAAVAVETSVPDLVRTAARCVAAGKHVHLDKPAGDSAAEFKTLLDDATRRGLVIQMGYMLRYNPAFQFLFRVVREGWLGQVFEVHGVISKTVDVSQRRLLSQFRGGSMFELGCHLIDALVAVMGKPSRVASYVRSTRPDQDQLADNCLAVFEYPRATATIRSALVEVDGFRRRQFVVCGDRGTAEIRPLEPGTLQLTLAESRGDFQRGTHQVPLPKLGGRYDGDFADLARIIRGEKKTDYPPAHDLAMHDALLQASGMDDV